MTKIPNPQPGEYAEYTHVYIRRVPEEGLILDYLVENLALLKSLLEPLSDTQLSTPHADGEWTIKEILVHLIDSERVFAYRALRFARNDTTALPGFEQDDYVPESRANERSLENIMEEYSAVREATLALFKNLPEETWERAGTGSNKPMSVRAAMYIVVGHELHHIASIEENYLD